MTQFEKPHPYESAVRAAMFHDRGWIRYETGPRLNKDTGKTPNYREVPNDDDQLQAFEWAGDWLSSIDAYAGLLISRHRTGLWQSRYGVMRQPPAIQRGKLSEAIAAFIVRSEARQKAAAQGLDPEELAKNYHLLQVWDLLSLYVCSQEQLERTRSSRCRPATRMRRACAWNSCRSTLRRSPSTPIRSIAHR